MEDPLQISAIENDDSFSFFYASLDEAKCSNTDELTQIGFLVGKLAEIRNKYEKISREMLDEMDAMEAKHVEDSTKKEIEFTRAMKTLQEAIQTYSNDLKVKEAEKNAAINYSSQIKGLLMSVHNRKLCIFIDF